METMRLVFVALFGLIWGSFLNVVIYRLPRGLNLARPPSTCPRCGARIRPYDNIPLLSYLLLGGKCRQCRAPISPIYPLVEALTAGSFILAFFHHGRDWSWPLLATSVFAGALIALGFIDFFHQILPDGITLPGFVLALAYAAVRKDLTLVQALLGATVGAGFLLATYLIYKGIRKKEGLGLGDVTMMLFIGAFVGWQKALLTLILASFAGALVGVVLIAVRKKGLQHALPFGTFLAPAAYAAALWGDVIISAYLGLFKR
jgi:leader peptidase (prepilin peptidase) / N-methyltransferase